MYHNISIDITTFEGDCIVNSLGAGRYIEEPGRIYRSILKASRDSSALMVEVTRLGKDLPFGAVYLTDSYGLACKKILHVVTPFYFNDPDCSQIAQCYEDLLKLAYESGLKSICLTTIGTGANGYPSDKVASIARRICYRFCEAHSDVDVYFDVYTVEVLSEDDEPYERERLRLIEERDELPSGAPTFEAPSVKEKPRIPLMIEIGMEFEDSFGTLVRKFVFKRTKGDKKAKEEALEQIWLEINSLVGDFKNDQETLPATIKSMHESKEAGLPTDPALLKEKYSHAPEYEWKKVKSSGKKGYVWQCPNKAEILLASIAMHLKPEEVFEVYSFCGYALSEYDRYDYAFRECIPLLSESDPWTHILQDYRMFTSESLYLYQENRKKKYTDHGEKW